MSGDINVQTFSGKVNITSNLLVGSSHLFVDTQNNRVGLITNTPAAGLHVESNAYVHTNFRVGSDIEMNVTAGRITAGAFHGDGTNITGINSDSGSWVNGTDVVYLSTIGDKVGIGTTSPGKELTVAGNMELGVNNGSYQHLRLGGGNSSGFLYSALQKYPDTINLGYNFYNDNSNNQVPNAGGGTSRIEMGYGHLKLHTGNTNAEPNNNALCIDYLGNVGIGTTSPGAKLDVNGGVILTGGTHGSRPTNDGSVLANAEIRGGPGVGSAGFLRLAAGGYNNGSASDATSKSFIDLCGYSSTSDFDRNISFHTLNQERMRINLSGNVGIGTTSPSSLLTFYKDYTVPANGSEPAADTTQGITFRSDLNSYGGAGAPIWSNPASPIDVAKIWFQPKAYTDMSGSAGVHGLLCFGTGYFGSQSSTADMVINSVGNVGIGTNDPQRSLHVKSTSGMVIEDNATTSAIYVDNEAQGETGEVYSYILNAPRPGTTGSGAVHFINGSGRTGDGGGSTYTIRNDSGKLRLGGTAGDTIIEGRVHITAGTVPAFTGMHTTSAATERAQLVLSSQYSDLVIASSYVNNNHGSTLSFAAVNPSNTAEYRKFVINQGNWGSRKDFLDFGLSASAADPNPHSSINSTDTVLTLDGNNKRVGIGMISPSAKLDVNGTFHAKNHGWRITGAGGNATYTAGELFFRSNKSPYGQYVTTYNSASSGQWSHSTGRFTFPTTGLYMITIHMFLNGTASGRYSRIYFRRTNGTANYDQYMLFPESLSNNQKSWSTFYYATANDYFYMAPEAGSITLYIAETHTVLEVYKIW